MNNTKVTLAPLEADDREQFILDNQESFRYGAVEEFGLRDDHFDEDGEIISQPLSKVLMHPTAKHTGFCMKAERLAVWC